MVENLEEGDPNHAPVAVKNLGEVSLNLTPTMDMTLRFVLDCIIVLWYWFDVFLRFKIVIVIVDGTWRVTIY